jgi:beta-alanine degradation protein BauB
MGEDVSGTFDPAEFAAELQGEPTEDVGTKLLFANERVKVWEIVLAPGQRAPFHRHVRAYFYVCAAPGRVRTRFPNGWYADGDEKAGGFAYMEHSPENPGIHDLENIGTTTVRYTTVELL